MAQMKADRPHTLIAAGAIANPYRFVKVSADYTVDVCGADEEAAGVNLNTASAAGEGVLVANAGSGVSVKLQVSAAVAAGAKIKSAAGGKGVTAATTNRYYARALQAATADGDIIEVQLETGVVP